MSREYQAPGVYLQAQFLQPRERLPTGIPGFIGFVRTGGANLRRARELSVSAVQADLPEAVALHRQEEFRDRFRPLDYSYLGDAVQGFFANGGTHCYVMPVYSPTEAALVAAIDALAALDDIDLVAIPDAVALDNTNATLRVQQALIEHCQRHGDRFAILDAVVASNEFTVVQQRQQLASSHASNSALYYPWLKRRPGSGRMPPCGHIAGCFARSDRHHGVFKAPANEILHGAIDLETPISRSEQAQLSPQGINCLKAFPGRGIRIWGARTLSSDPTWRYINARRLVITLRRWIERTLGWVAFEPNVPTLWVRIQRELSGYLTALWQAGGLKGTTAEEAFYVKCDIETNPPEAQTLGQVITEIGLAIAQPAEFIVLQITHRADSIDVNA